MPWESDAQRKWGHTRAGEEALGGPSKVAEWDHASKGMKLPERKMTQYAKGGAIADAKYAKGGGVLPRLGDFKKTVPNRGFLDTPDRFTGGRKPAGYPEEKNTQEDWSKPKGKGHTDPDDSGDYKSEKPIKPRG